MVYAYVVESSLKGINIDNSALQEAILENQIDECCVLTDEVESLERPELMKFKEVAVSGDIILVRSIGDLAYSLRQLVKGLTYLEAEKITIVSINEPCYSFHKYQQVLSSFMLIEQEWKEVKRIRGIEKATAEGRMGRKTDRDKVLNAIRLYNTRSFTIQEIKGMTGVSTSTLYRALKNMDNQ